MKKQEIKRNPFLDHAVEVTRQIEEVRDRSFCKRLR